MWGSMEEGECPVVCSMELTGTLQLLIFLLVLDVSEEGGKLVIWMERPDSDVGGAGPGGILAHTSVMLGAKEVAVLGIAGELFMVL